MAKQKPTIKTKLALAELIELVEFLVKKDNMSYSEAICEICEQRQLEPEDVAKLIKKGPLKNKLEVEAMKRNIVKSSTATLF
jgi:hypothetical protein|tara:strand:- start:1503 stop:1748 length:246 start_codon:yes stop_codon:yes gene_type:complete